MSTMMRVVYVSRSTFPCFSLGQGIEPTVARILFESRKNNPKRGLVGALYYGDGCFFQCLEGEQTQIEQLYARLQQDPRHKDIKILSKQVIERPAFFEWSMKYIAVEQRVKQFISDNGFKKFDPYAFSPDMAERFLSIFEEEPSDIDDHTVGHLAQQADVLEQEYGKEKALAFVTLSLFGMFGLLATALVWLSLAQV